MLKFYLAEYFNDSHAPFYYKILRFFVFCILAPILVFPAAFKFWNVFSFCNLRNFISGNLYDCELNINIIGREGFIEPSLYDIINRYLMDIIRLPQGSPFEVVIMSIWILLIILYTITKPVDYREEQILNALGYLKSSKNEKIYNYVISYFFYILFFGFIISFIPSSYMVVEGHEILNGLNKFGLTLLYLLLSTFIFVLPFSGAFVFKLHIERRLDGKTVIHDELISRLSTEKNYLEQDESLFLEFKTSFQTSYPVRPEAKKSETGETYFTIGSGRRFKSIREVERLLQDMVLEAVVGFLNASGGELVIGINEKDNVKVIVGVEYEEIGSEDEYQRHIIQQIINRIGKNYMGDYIDTCFKKVDSKTIFIITVKPFIPRQGQIPVLLDGVYCFKRTGPRTDPIKAGEEFAKFVVDRGLIDKGINRS